MGGMKTKKKKCRNECKNNQPTPKKSIKQIKELFHLTHTHIQKKLIKLFLQSDSFIHLSVWIVRFIEQTFSQEHTLLEFSSFIFIQHKETSCLHPPPPQRLLVCSYFLIRRSSFKQKQKKIKLCETHRLRIQSKNILN